MTFQEFLEEKHAEQYQGLDDHMPDAENDWIENLDVQEVIDYAEEWKELIIDRKSKELK